MIPSHRNRTLFFMAEEAVFYLEYLQFPISMILRDAMILFR